MRGLLLTAALACAEAAAPPPVCRPGFTLEGLESQPSRLLSLPLRVYRNYGYEHYFSCMAYARGLQVCDALRPVDAKMARGEPERDAYLTLDCQKTAVYSRMTRSALESKPPLGEFCRGMERDRPDLYGRLYALILCDDIAAHPDDSKGVCAAAGPKVSRVAGHPRNFSPERCAVNVDAFFGRGDCSGLNDGEEVQCRSALAYKEASRARDASRCGEWPMCRVMMGGGEDACRAYARKVQKDFCAEAAP